MKVQNKDESPYRHDYIMVSNILIVYESNRLNALKTVSLRIQSAKAKIDDAGLDGEDMVESTAELRRLIIAATGVDILESDQKTFRSTYQILLDISKVWQDIDDITRSSVLQKIAGKQQSNIVSAILNNGELLEQVYAEAMDSAGTAMKEQEVWADSIEAKFNRISGVFESISSNMLSSDTFKSVLDTFNRILDVVDSLTKSGMGLIPVFTSISTLMGGMGNGFFSAQNRAQNMALISSYNTMLGTSAENMATFTASMAQSNPRFAQYITNLNGAETTLRDYNSYLLRTQASTVALRVGTVALNMAMNALIGLGISVLITLVSKAINKQKELSQAFEDGTSSINNYLDSIDSYKERIESIISSDADEAEQLTQLGEIKDELSDKYRTEIEDLENVTQARQALLDVINAEGDAELKDYYLENREQFEKTADEFNKFKTETINDDNKFFSDKYIESADKVIKAYQAGIKHSVDEFDIGEDIKSLFDSFEVSNPDIFTSSLGVKIDGDNPIDYYNNLKTVIEEIEEIEAKSEKGLTKTEQSLYNKLKNRYNELNDYLYGETNRADTYIASLEPMARYYMSIVPQAERTTEEWRDVLFSLGGVSNNILLQETIDRLINADNAVKDISESTEELSENLVDALSGIQKVNSACEELSTGIKDADEKFEKLTDTISKNKDVDKFFSASEIIELLETYPELADSVLECAYGYKIEEEALESLRQTKLEEKKVALETQLDEANALLKATEVKIKAYGAELGSIKDVASAKIKLAELETKLAGLTVDPNSYSAIDRVRNAVESAKLQGQINDIKDYIDVSEAAEKAEKEVNALYTELEVLGTVHDELKDATDAATDSLNTEKDTINELKDAMSDAKDYINDLIDLTIQYLKKSKELEKESIQNQIDEFKELCDRKKELLKLEKDQYEYEKKIKDQNKSLLQTQLELEALSVEGVQYSLEDQLRKAELEQELSEKQDERNEYLYDHEIELREKAIDDEEESYTKSLEVQIKSIEDYLSKEGNLRAEAIRLIDGKSQEFYDNLMQYTLTYTDKSAYEFNQLWNSAYDAIMTYANGEVNVELALMNVIGGLELAETQLKNIETQLNNIKHATDDAKDSAIQYQQAVTETAKALRRLNEIKAEQQATYKNASTVDKIVYATESSAYASLANELLKNAKKEANKETHHSGGIVGGISTEHGEVLAKLLKGEVVVTEGQAQNFMENTLPKLTGNSTVTNNSMSPVINIGDIVVNGNADTSVISQLNNVRQQIVDDVFKVVNNQKNIYSGGRLRTV